MSKNLFRSLIALITYTVLLCLFLVHADRVAGALGGVLSACKPLFVGFAIAFVLDRPCKFFLRTYEKGLPKRFCRPLAVLSAYISLFAVLVAVISFIIPQLLDSIELFISNLNGYMLSLQALWDAVVKRLDVEYLQSLDLTGLSDILRRMGNAAMETLTNAGQRLFSITGALVSFVVTGVLSLVFSVYMLSGSQSLLRQCRRLVLAYLPEHLGRALLSVAALSADTFTRFVSGQALEACILGGLCFAGMVVLRLPYAPLVGVIIGLSALIPVAGAYIGAILSALILVMVSPMKALIFLVFLLILQQVEGNVIYPRVVGTSLGLPGLWVLAAVTVGGGLFGFLGMLLSVPVTSVLYTLLKSDVARRLDETDS